MGNSKDFWIKLYTPAKCLLFVLIFLFLLVGHAAPIHATALSPEDNKSILEDTVQFKKGGDSSCLGGPAGSGPLYGALFPQVADTASLATKIQDYIKKSSPKSPLADFANDFVKFGQQYNANPVMVVAMAQKETSLGTAGNGTPHGGYNVTNVRPGGSFAKYGSYDEGIEASFKNLRSKLYLGPPSNFTTVDQVINRWAPPSDNNDTTGYISFVNDVLQKILGSSAAGSSTTVTVPTCGTNGGTPGTAGALGWDMPVSGAAHPMVSYDQTDPKYANHPYGAGKSPIGDSGCGPTSLAMIGATLLGNTDITPITIADRYGATYHTDGTSWALMSVFAKDYNLKVQDLGTNLQNAANVIRSGGLVLISVDPGYFTSQGHFMVIRAITPDGTGFYLADPNGKGIHGDSETRAFTADFLASSGSMLHLWGYTK